VKWGLLGERLGILSGGGRGIIGACMHLRIVGFVLVALVFAGTGCGKRGPKLHPVKGQVFFLDQPAAGAQVVFQPTGGVNAEANMASGTVGPDGTFTLSTYPYGEGAQAGDYHVLINWMPENARELENPKNKLPAKYGDSLNPTLKATVKEGPNDVPAFRLTK